MFWIPTAYPSTKVSNCAHGLPHILSFARRLSPYVYNHNYSKRISAMECQIRVFIRRERSMGLIMESTYHFRELDVRHTTGSPAECVSGLATVQTPFRFLDLHSLHCVGCFHRSIMFIGVVTHLCWRQWFVCCVPCMFSSCALSTFEFASFASSSNVNGWTG